MTRVVLFGATGFTGRLTAAEMTARGLRPVLAGRDERRVVELAASLGGLEHAFADATRPETVAALLHRGDVIVTTVGPFARWGHAAVDAAVQTGATYIDSTGEPSFIRTVFERHGPDARRAGAALIPAMGYDYLPGSLAGALALERAGDTARRVDVAYFVVGRSASAGVSRGTRRSAVGAALEPSFAFRDGSLRTVSSADRSRRFVVDGCSRPAVSVGGAEHFALPAAYPRLREVNVYGGWFGRLSPLLRPALIAASTAGRHAAVRHLLQAAGDALVERSASGPADGAGGRSLVLAASHDAAGRPLARARLIGPEPYAFTAGVLAESALRLARRPPAASGAQGPLQALGLAGLREACANAGMHSSVAAVRP